MAAKTIPDPTANTMAALVYNRDPGAPTTLIGTYVNQGAVFTSTSVASSAIDAAIDAVIALLFVTPPVANAIVHVEIDLAGTALVVDFRNPGNARNARIEVNSAFGAALITAARNVFTQAFAAGMQAALGF